MDNKEVKTILKLFKSYLKDERNNDNKLHFNKDYGIVFQGNPDSEVIDCAYELYGLNGERLNQTLHKSFGKVIDSSIEKLIVDQIYHYFSTYGLESLGITNDNYIYIPYEKLEIPEIKEDLQFVYINRITKDQLVDKIMTLITSNIALSEETIEDLKVISEYIPKNRFDEVNNREFRLYLYDKYNIVPKNPETFIKYVLYKITNQTLNIVNEYDYIEEKQKYIKRKSPNNSLAYIINNNKINEIYYLFKRFIFLYESEKEACKKLATIFFRYKTLFFTLKSFCKSTKNEKDLKRIINRTKRYTKNEHKPLKASIIDNIFSINSEDLFGYINYDDLIKKLDSISIYRELRLLNYMKGILNSDNNKLDFYRIRNGKVFVRDKKNKKYLTLSSKQNNIYSIVYNHLDERISKNFKDNTFYIPEYLKLAVPISEKKFIDNIPEKSYIQLPREKNIVIGINWFDIDEDKSYSKYTEDRRVDLDIHLINKQKHLGWSGNYKTSVGDIVFSGDITAAPKPKGASEYFLIRNYAEEDSFLLTMNNFRGVFDSKNKINFEFVIAATDESKLYENYIIDPNDVLVKMNMTQYKDNGLQMCLGLLEVNKYDIKFYFTNFDTGSKTRTTRNDEVTMKIYRGLKEDLEKTLYIDELISDFGGKVLDKPYREELKEVIIDNKVYYEKVKNEVSYNLSLNNISKETIINLFKEDN